MSSMVVLKSVTLAPERRPLQAHPQPPAPQGVADAVDGEVAVRARIEAELRQEIQARFDADLAQAREDAHAQGYKAGMAAGHADGMASAEDLSRKRLLAMEQVLSTAESQIAQWSASVSDQAYELARAALCEFLGEQALEPKFLQGLIARMASSLKESDVLAIRLHPAEAQQLRLAAKHLAAPDYLLARLKDDGAMVSGGVVIETPRGDYCATLDVQMRRVLTWLAERREALSHVGAMHVVRA